MSHDDSRARGAYGFRLNYPEQGDHLRDLVQLDPSAPAVTISWRYACATEDIEEVHEDRVTYGVRGGAATFRVHRHPASIRFDLAEPPVPAALVHPLLTVGISILARWRGEVTLHAGAFETQAGAWGIMGAREAGKSAMLAGLAQRGYPVVADDLLTIQNGTVWAGPHCVDLRPDTAERFDSARYLGVIGGRPRYRLSTPPGRPRVPLRGFFMLDWHDRPLIDTEPLTSRERLERLYRQEYIPLVGYPDPRKLLPLLGLPAWRLTRPSDWGATEAAVDRVLSIAESHPLRSTSSPRLRWQG